MTQATKLFLPLFALIAPFALYPLELLLPFPFIIEELVKAGLAFPLLSEANHRKQQYAGILMGILFTLSETVLYLFNLSSAGTQFLFVRLLLTGGLHTLTMLIIILLANINKKLFPLGIATAMILHYLYNQYITL